MTPQVELSRLGNSVRLENTAGPQHTLTGSSWGLKTGVKFTAGLGQGHAKWRPRQGHKGRGWCADGSQAGQDDAGGKRAQAQKLHKAQGPPGVSTALAWPPPRSCSGIKVESLRRVRLYHSVVYFLTAFLR